MDESNLLLNIKTIQSSAFRILIEALKEILTDANMEFDKTGLKIIRMDLTHTVLVHLKLSADDFEYYYCEREKTNPLVVGVNMIFLFKLIRTIGNDDTLHLYIEKANQGVLGIIIENSEKNSVTKYKLNLMDLDEEYFTIPNTVFDSVITLPSSDFQKIVKDINNLSSDIEIKSITNENGSRLIFSCKGDFAEQETIIGETQDGIVFSKLDENAENNFSIVQGVFSAKHLVSFCKCTNLCNSIEIYLKNDYPLILKYTCASLGSIKLCLAPKLEEKSHLLDY